MKKTKIVCTIGPASETTEVLEQLIKAGMNVMRLNFSHGDHEEHLAKVKTLRAINEKLGTNIAFMLDTKGPEIRTGSFGTDQKTKMDFTKGDKITLTTRDVEGSKELLSVTYTGLPNDVEVGGHILIDDGLVDLLIDEIDGTEIKCTFQNSATLKGKRGVNVPGAKLQLNAMTEKDKSDLRFAVENGFDFVAASFIRKPQDVIEMREYLNSVGKNNIKIISKIENQEGLDNFDEILKVTDGVMVARGDLGVEIPEELVPAAQKMMIKKTVEAGKTVITATQMLESMTHQPLPTRAEASDVANAIYDRTSAIMLSGECAQGDYPVECVKTMVKIANRVEPEIHYWKRFSNNEDLDLSNDVTKIAYSACVTAKNMNADAIVTYTHTGDSVRKLAGLGAGCPILAITDNKRTFHQLALAWNVTPIYVEAGATIEETIDKGIEKLKNKEILEKGDVVVLSGGAKTFSSGMTKKVIGGILRID